MQSKQLEYEFCKNWCGELTDSQKIILFHKVKRGEFLGVGRPIGSTRWMPMVLIGKSSNVIDEAGYYQLASVEGRRGFTPNASVDARQASQQTKEAR